MFFLLGDWCGSWFVFSCDWVYECCCCVLVTGLGFLLVACWAGVGWQFHDILWFGFALLVGSSGWGGGLEVVGWGVVCGVGLGGGGAGWGGLHSRWDAGGGEVELVLVSGFSGFWLFAVEEFAWFGFFLMVVVVFLGGSVMLFFYCGRVLLCFRGMYFFYWFFCTVWFCWLVMGVTGCVLRVCCGGSCGGVGGGWWLGWGCFVLVGFCAWCRLYCCSWVVLLGLVG